MAGLSQMIENPKRKPGIASDDKTVETKDSLSKKDLALIRPASRRGGKKSGNGSSSSLMDLSQLLEGNDSASSFDKDMAPDNIPKRKQGIASDDKTVATIDSLSQKDMALIRPASRRGGKKSGNGSSSSLMDLLESTNDSASSFDKDMGPDDTPKRKQGISSDDKTVATMDSLSQKDMALIRPASRRGGKKTGNGSSSSSMELSLSQLLEGSDSASSFGSSNKDMEPDNITMDGTVDSRDCIRVPRTTKRGGKRRPQKEETTTKE